MAVLLGNLVRLWDLGGLVLFGVGMMAGLVGGGSRACVAGFVRGPPVSGLHRVLNDLSPLAPPDLWLLGVAHGLFLPEGNLDAPQDPGRDRVRLGSEMGS